tara:strand:- start:99 stop:1598 length:1500 start_codon:yes stop_codon:yes gene_type:complete
MATFEVQVEGMTSIAITGSTDPSQDELTEFLKDGVIDVTNRWLAMKPQDKENFIRKSSTTASNGLDLNGADIISVIREAGTDGDTDGSTAWRNCRKIPISLQSRVVDTESLNFASKYNPVYTVDDDGYINVYPVPDGTDDGFRVFYVNHEPMDGSGGALTYSDSTIKFFPNDKIYLVVIYASMRTLQAKMGATTITDLSVTAVPPDVPSLSASSVSFSQTAPAYTKVSFTNDPSAFSLNAVPPDVPTLGSTSVTITGTAPTYTAPVVAGATEELTTTITAGAAGTAGDKIDWTDWWDVLADYIEDEEDTELAGIQLQKISSYLQAYSTAMQNQLNIFNDANVEYQAILQKDLKDAEFDNQEDARLLQKYQADLAVYQADVSAEVQEYTQKLQYGMQTYQADIQQELNEFNKENAEYQAQLQISLKNADFDNQEDARKVQKYQAEQASYAAEVNSQVQEYTQNLQADGTGYQWLQDQYTRLKAEYDAAFMMAVPKPQAAR